MVKTGWIGQRKFLFFISLVTMVAASVFNLSRSFAATNGLVFETILEKKTNSKEVLKGTIAIPDVSQDYYLSVVALDKKSAAVSVQMNGKVIANTLQMVLRKRQLVSIAPNQTNSVEVTMLGKAGARVKLEILRLSDFEAKLAAEEFKVVKSPLTAARKFTSQNPTEPHLLVVEALSKNILQRPIGTISLNKKVVVGPLDFIFNKNQRFMKLITVAEANDLQVQLIGLKGAGVKIGVLSPKALTEPYPSEATLQLVGLDPKKFNDVYAPLLVNVVGAELPTSNAKVSVSHNGRSLEEWEYSITKNSIKAMELLQPGLNEIQIDAFDIDGGQLSLSANIWAGESQVEVSVASSAAPIANAQVSAQLADDTEVVVLATTNANGIAVIKNVPPRTILFEAKSGGRLATGSELVEDSMSIDLFFPDLLPPSDVNNNDFSQGLLGWNTYDSDVTLEPHVEEIQDDEGLMARAAKLDYSKLSDKEVTAKRIELRRQLSSQAKRLSKSGISILSGAEGDVDLTISTGGKQGASRVSRAFKTGLGTKAVKIRYRFVTSEIPGGYYGTKYNDSFSVLLMSTAEGQATGSSGSMNGLGRAAFTSSGSTAWRELTVPIVTEGAVVQLDLSVSNVSDGALDSKLIIDYIEEVQFAIKSATLFDIDNSKLGYLSVSSSNPYKDGKTIVNGSLEILGAEGVSLTKLELEILQNGGVKARADLDPARASLLSAFNSTHLKTVTKQQLFNLSKGQAGNIDVSENGVVILRIKAMSSKGETATYDLGKVEILTRYEYGEEYRYSPDRDTGDGGDDWVTPSCLATANALSEALHGSINFQVNDFSNMNGGYFTLHTSHEYGVDFDFAFTGSSKVDKKVAERLLEIARSDDNIALIGVTYSDNGSNPFYDAIKDEKIRGRDATDILRPWSKHVGHFHMRCAK